MRGTPSAWCLIIVVGWSGCTTDPRIEVESAMREYDRLIFAMNADSLALCFLPMGKLAGEGMPVVAGRDSIRKFLKTFDTMKIEMISNQSTPASFEMRGDTAVLKGTYEQQARIPPAEPGTYRGKFEALWLKEDGGRWRLYSMYTWPEH